MKILYIGHYKEGTGWAHAAIDYILSLDAAGLDVVCRSIDFNHKNITIPKRITELENKSSKGCDICIQHVLPHKMDFNGKFKKNIALYATETDSFIATTWPDRINLMDEAWVINKQMVDASIKSGITVPIKIIPHACDTSKFERNYTRFEIPQIQDTFVFYFIGELIRRKNLVALLKAFHLEFDSNEPVSLAIKAHKTGMNEDECFKHITIMCDQVKENLKLYPQMDDYKREIIITQYLSEIEMCSLHTTCDCLVAPSFGEAWCIPAFDAMGFGNTPICTNTGGMADFLSGGGGMLVDAHPEPAFGMTETFSDLYTGRENWDNIDIRELQKRMRNVYELHSSNSPAYLATKKLGLENAYRYSYENVGKIMKEALTNAN